MNKKTVIGLAGVKTSGKSTAANMIYEFVNAKEVALADKLKDTCAEVFILEREQFDAQELKEVPFPEEEIRKLSTSHIIDILKSFDIKMTPEEMVEKYSNFIGMSLETPRKIAQIVGTEILRAAGDEDIHCKNITLNPKGITVVTDLRFPNEFEYFNNKKDIHFIPLHIQRDLAEDLITEGSHPSETSVFKFTDKCIKIDNNGSFRNTELQIKKTLDIHIFNNKEKKNVRT
jgi:dephospho-CoA kinase